VLSPRAILLDRLAAKAVKVFPSAGILFRIIDVKNILEALINVGREDMGERGTAAPQQSHAKLLLDFNWKTIILVE